MYNLSDHYFEAPCCTEETECNACNSKDRQILTVADNLVALVYMLYGKKPLNMADLRETLEDMCHALDVIMPKGTPNIQRSEPLTQVNISQQ